MRHLRLSRVIFSAGLAMGGLVGTGTVLVASGAAPAFAGSFCPSSSAPIVCVSPTTGVTNHEFLKVVVRTTPNTSIAITECNHNLAAQDPNSCDQNIADVGKPGGPKIGTTDATGKVSFSYQVRVTLNPAKPIGDGQCAPGGDTCFIIAAVVATQQPVAATNNPTPFTTQ
jgi:hypothetical protein